MAFVQKWSTIFSLGYALFTNQIFSFFEFVNVYPDVLSDLFWISILGVMGQIFIFYTI